MFDCCPSLMMHSLVCWAEWQQTGYINTAFLAILVHTSVMHCLQSLVSNDNWNQQNQQLLGMLKMQIFGTSPQTYWIRNLGSIACFNELCRWFWCKLRFENHRLKLFVPDFYWTKKQTQTPALSAYPKHSVARFSK